MQSPYGCGTGGASGKGRSPHELAVRPSCFIEGIGETSIQVGDLRPRALSAPPPNES